MKRKGLSLLLALAMVLTMVPQAVFGAGSFTTGNYVQIQEQSLGDDIYKLVVSASTDDGVSSMDMVLSFDNTVVVPVRAEDTNKKVEIEHGDTRQTPVKAIGEDTEGGKFVLSPTLWKVHGGRTAIHQAVYITDRKYLEKEAGTRPMMELYYTLRDGKTTEDLNGATFQIESAWGESREDSFLYDFYNGVYADTTAGLTVDSALTPSGKFFFGQANGKPAGLELDLTYTGSNRVEPEQQKPTAPTGVSIIQTGKSTATISWTAPVLNDGVPEITGYEITGDNDFTKVTAGKTAVSAELTGLRKGTAYTFQVQAVNSNGSGAGTDAKLTTWKEPGAPVLTEVKGGNLNAALTWTAPEDTGNDGSALKYKVYASTDAACNGSYVKGYDGKEVSALTETVSGLEKGTTYYFKVTALNSGYEGSASEIQSIVAMDIVNAEAPAVTVSDSALTVNYGAAASLAVSASVTDGGTLSYQWYEAASADAVTGTAIASATQAGYTTPVLKEAKTTYYFCVATNTNDSDVIISTGGSRTASSQSGLIAVTVVPAKPAVSDLKLTAGNGKLDAKWNAEANGSEIKYFTVKLTHEEAAQSAQVKLYEYVDAAGAAKTVRVTAGAVDPTFTAAGKRYITDGAVAYPIATESAITAEITPAGIVKDMETTTSATSYSFTGLKNGTLYTMTLTASNGVGDSTELMAAATPKASSSGGGGGGGGGSSSGGSTATGTDVKKDIPSSGSVTISTSELKDAKSIEAKSSQITVTLNQQAIGKLDKMAGLVIKTEKKSGITMNDGAKELLGSRPVFDVTATQNGKAVTDFGSGKITISIAYTPASGENAGKLGLYYIDEKGEAQKVSGSKYDATMKAVTGQTNHLSVYAVGYDKNAADTSTPVTPGSTGVFRDVSSSDWFYTAVMNLAGREILSGVPDEDAKGNPTGTYTFRPQNNVTRAEFVTMLAKAAGVSLSTYSTTAFNDVSANDWYAGAVAWASTVGVASGTGDGAFSPNANITRQDMAVMISKYVSSVAKTTLPAKNEKTAFTDASQIAEYAAGAVESMQTAGILSGVPNEDAKGNSIGTYQFRPFANATRAEAAAMLNGLLSSVQ